MAREIKPATRAINAGIGARIQELGFRRKSGRLWLKEDKRFAEYVIFRTNGLEFDQDLGIFDKDFDAFMDGLPERGSNVSDSPRPCHVSECSLSAWRKHEQHEEHLILRQLKFSRPWTLIWPGLKPISKPASKKTPFATDYGKWRAAEDWEGCAALSLEKFDEYVVPWRERMRTDVNALMDEFCGYSRGGQSQVMCAHAYAGRWPEVYEMIEIAKRHIGEPPTKEQIRDYKIHHSNDPKCVEELIETVIRNNSELHKELEVLAAALEARKAPPPL